MLILQIIIALILIALVMIQSKASGLSSSVAGSFGLYRSRRGVEKAVFILTILSGTAFVASSLLLIS
ncbi:TPA: preprotein translocase subunit SecG [candidate division WWE3 bacterium]|uniref:Protein-export membrane protein SecG n=5 Tax=Katanobacteria TaxID=422282 RepID=A0A0G1MV24_UNCKA|nr:MAG: Preprotein translocase, SecG subunit [candidate division WWE3 bacterium GW2011_GWA2_44_16]KKT69892.1 MAG: Preprotein translocase, SecG subunit [candidate division WWE3 bacterium GW2011_GWB1_44_4]KKT84597.1 MAG: Preprotein translocase, SecG subunit [candidate division WWE3 bacterium GW2011_GWC2_44_9]OGC51179.1 MAG: preprotein translocase subunit SecG [candidate division WWE3 bacterium RIFCSPHIGHO2_01_FULL_43_9]HAZ29878.1 preprotein translocase subunit SecG [candidate division WWE3 bacter